MGDVEPPSLSGALACGLRDAAVEVVGTARIELALSRVPAEVKSRYLWPNAPEWPLRATRIGIETVRVIAGRKDVRVKYARTDDGAEYTVVWK